MFSGFRFFLMSSRKGTTHLFVNRRFGRSLLFSCSCSRKSVSEVQLKHQIRNELIVNPFMTMSDDVVGHHHKNVYFMESYQTFNSTLLITLSTNIYGQRGFWGLHWLLFHSYLTKNARNCKIIAFPGKIRAVPRGSHAKITRVVKEWGYFQGKNFSDITSLSLVDFDKARSASGRRLNLSLQEPRQEVSFITSLKNFLFCQQVAKLNKLDEATSQFVSIACQNNPTDPSCSRDTKSVTSFIRGFHEEGRPTRRWASWGQIRQPLIAF